MKKKVIVAAAAVLLIILTLAGCKINNGKSMNGSIIAPSAMTAAPTPATANKPTQEPLAYLNKPVTYISLEQLENETYKKMASDTYDFWAKEREYYVVRLNVHEFKQSSETKMSLSVDEEIYTNENPDSAEVLTSTYYFENVEGKWGLVFID